MSTRPRTSGYRVSCSRSAIFPLDMLRFSESWPLSTEAAGLIEALVTRDPAVIDRLPSRVTITLGTINNDLMTMHPTIVRRWESFGFKVEALTDTAPAISEEEAIEAIEGIRRLMADTTISSANFKNNVINDTCATLADKLPGVSEFSVRALCRSERSAVQIAKGWFEPEFA